MDPRQLRDLVVRPSLAALGLPGGEAAERLVMGTAAHESGGFRYIHQVGGGPALSLWQIEPATAEDAWDRAGEAQRNAMEHLGVGYPVRLAWEEVLPGNLYLGAALCRLVYYLKPFEMPTGLRWEVSPYDLAVIWKRWWNTEEGAGHPEQFVQAYREHVQPLYGY